MASCFPTHDECLQNELETFDHVVLKYLNLKFIPL